MSLQATLEEMKAKFVANVDPQVLEAMNKAKQQFDTEAMMAGIIQVGATAPDFTLQDANGQEVSSAALRQKGSILLTLYRGVW